MEEGAGAAPRTLIADLPSNDRPRERLAAAGASALSNSELLAILLRTGVEGKSAIHLAEELLSKHGGIAGLLRSSYDDLCTVKGIGEAKAAQLKAAVELGRRLVAASPEDRPTINSPADAANMLMLDMGHLDQEHLRVMLLDTRNRVLKIVEVYKGSLDTSLVRVGELFREAIRINAAGIIVAHNHPSGDPSPSPEDLVLTRMVVEAGKLLSISVVDHLIIGQQRFVSLKERGLGFNV
ncbi:MAG: DNA repair protein RadC [Chloroflexi bacterium]|nr:DNA repair protein RadC [Chloroflexota bacterium]MBI3761872.1 DNA repair protein RadC [Chloroflexota bacterium]